MLIPATRRHRLSRPLLLLRVFLLLQVLRKRLAGILVGTVMLVRIFVLHIASVVLLTGGTDHLFALAAQYFIVELNQRAARPALLLGVPVVSRPPAAVVYRLKFVLLHRTSLLLSVSISLFITLSGQPRGVRDGEY